MPLSISWMLANALPIKHLYNTCVENYKPLANVRFVTSTDAFESTSLYQKGEFKTNVSKTLKRLYDHHTCLTITINALPSMRMDCDCLRKYCGRDWEYAFLANFRSMFLQIRNTSWRTANTYEHLRMDCDHLMIIANWLKIAFVSPFATMYRAVLQILEKNFLEKK